jgi:hypothetical protein
MSDAAEPPASGRPGPPAADGASTVDAAHWTHFPAGGGPPLWDSGAADGDRGAPGPTAAGPLSPFASEADFEETVVAPLLAGWGLPFERQFPVAFYIGSQPYRGRVDFLVRDAAGRPVTLLESKARITTESALRAAVGQGRSYALNLGLPSFVVAAPEGWWVYSLDGPQERWEATVWPHELAAQGAALRDLLLALRDGAAAAPAAPVAPVIRLPCPVCGVSQPLPRSGAAPCGACGAWLQARRRPGSVRLEVAGAGGKSQF